MKYKKISGTFARRIARGESTSQPPFYEALFNGLGTKGIAHAFSALRQARTSRLALVNTLILKHLDTLLLLLASLTACAQETSTPPQNDWRFSAWAELFIIPGEQDFLNPTFYARHNKLHLEARYNYEDFQTTSLWAGRRFEFGKDMKFVFVPMAGVVFGNTNGMAPGLEMEIIYKKFDFYSESERVFDFHTKDNNFFYQYGELAMRPVKAIRAGMVVQRTRVVDTERELQRGAFAEYYYKSFRAGVFAFGPFSEARYWIASVSIDF
jgi:hypothetical protein